MTDATVSAGRGVAIIRNLMLPLTLWVLIAAAPPISFSQSNPDLQTFFRQNIGLNEDQVAMIRNGQPVTKTLPSRKPAEIFLFGAVYIHAAPEAYVRFARDFDRLSKLPGYLALGVFSNPPQPSDLKNFAFENDDIQDLKNCKLRDCQIQLPASSIEEFQRYINWSAPNVNEQVNQLLQKTALQRLLTYQREGNQALGVYNDKRDPTEVPQLFAYMLSYSKALPERLPDFYHYLLAYPKDKPANVDDTFYWARVSEQAGLTGPKGSDCSQDRSRPVDFKSPNLAPSIRTPGGIVAFHSWVVDD